MNMQRHARRAFTRLGLAALLLMTSWLGQAGAQEAPEPAAVAARFAEWNRTLERIGRDINGLRLDATQIEALAEQAAGLRSQAVEFGGELQRYAAEARELRDAFIASMPAGATETPEAQAQGKELRDRVGLFEGWIRQVDLAVARADQVLDKISTKRLDQLAASLTERGPAPINPLVWWRAIEDASAMLQLAASGIADEARSWRRADQDYGTVALTVLAVAVIFGLAAAMAARLAGRRSWPVLGPLLGGPASRSALAVLRSAAPWVVAVVVAAQAAPLKDWLPEAPGRAAITALVAAGLTAALCFWTLRAALVRPPAGVAPLVPDDAGRQALRHAMTALILLFAIDTAVQQLTVTFAGANLLALWALLWTVVGSIVGRRAVRIVGRVLLDQKAADGKLTRLLLLVVPMTVAALSIVASALGYARLGSYVFSNSLTTAVIVFLAWASRLIAQELIVRAGDLESPAGRLLQHRLGADQPTLRLAQFWLGILCDIALLIGSVVALMVTWGTGSEDALLMLERLIEGVRVGNVTLSLTDLIAAIAIFMIGVWITRLAQKVLDRRVFPGTQLDLGVRNSLRSGLGYIGVIIAGAVAILALGINLSGLALVAGALTVGIGFGLQHIINNFVSGLILLIERPVKVGDWITVGSNEGMVNRINVRSTEIITDHRASVLIPNADFLSVSVTNWTFKDRFARLHITFQLPESLGADGGRDLLLACAKANPNVQTDPPPRVLLQAMASGSYTFALAADVADVTMMKEVASDLRFAVDRELRKKTA